MPDPKFISVAEFVGNLRDEDGVPLVPAVGHGLVEEWGKTGTVRSAGRRCNEAGEPGPWGGIPAEVWRLMRFPFASQQHQHDTFWNSGGGLAYVDIALDAEDLARAMAPPPVLPAEAAMPRGRHAPQAPEEADTLFSRRYEEYRRIHGKAPTLQEDQDWADELNGFGGYQITRRMVEELRRRHRTVPEKRRQATPRRPPGRRV
jgi:hypothetical protein